MPASKMYGPDQQAFSKGIIIHNVIHLGSDIDANGPCGNDVCVIESDIDANGPRGNDVCVTGSACL